MRYPNNIKKLQAGRGWTIDQAAEALGISRGGFLKIQRGENRLTSTTIDLAAKAFGVSKSEIVEMNAPKAPVVGYAAANSDAVTFYGTAQGPFDEVEAPSGATDKTVAVRIRGTSLGKPFNNWLAFYDDRKDPPDESLYGELCVCELPGDRVLIKTLRKGTAKGLYNLESVTEPTLEDQPVLWAALVREMRRR